MKIAVIGTGNMGSAIARHLAKDHQLILNNRTPEEAKKLSKEIGATFEPNAYKAIEQAEWVVLAIKPQDLNAFVSSGTLAKGKVIISILAAKSLEQLKSLFPGSTLIRCMPNLALSVNEGVLGFAEDSSLPQALIKKVHALFDELGLIVWLPEKQINALAALAGSGLGLAFQLIEAMIDGGVLIGLSAEKSRDLVLQTFVGAVAMIRQTKKHPAELKLQVASPGGITIEGLKVLKDKAVSGAIMSALEAIMKKNREIQ